LPQLKQLNPPDTDTGRRKHVHHQFLTPDTGHPHLDKQIIEVVTLMRVSEDKEAFKKLFERAFPKRSKKNDGQKWRVPISNATLRRNTIQGNLKTPEFS